MVPSYTFSYKINRLICMKPRGKEEVEMVRRKRESLIEKLKDNP